MTWSFKPGFFIIVLELKSVELLICRDWNEQSKSSFQGLISSLFYGFQNPSEVTETSK